MRRIVAKVVFLALTAWIRPGEIGAAVVPAPPGVSRIFFLTVDEAACLALETNPDVRIAAIEARISRTAKDRTQSLFDSILEGGFTYEKDRRQQVSSFIGNHSLTRTARVGLTKRLPTGTTVGLDVKEDRTWSDSGFVTLNPAHEAVIALRLEQTLGRNLFGRMDRAAVARTLKDIEAADAGALRRIEEALAGVRKAFWAAREAVDREAVSAAMLQRARQLLAFDEDRARYGLVEPPELLAARAHVLRRENDLALARNARAAALDHLRLLLNLDDERIRVVPVRSGAGPETFAEGPSQVLARALTHRADYRAARASLAARRIAVRMNRDGLGPRIDLAATLQRNGVMDAAAEAFDEVLSSDHTDVFAGLTVRFPLENRRARSDLDAARLEKARAVIALKYLERRIVVEVTERLRSCRVFAEAWTKARAVLDLEEKKLAEERKRLRQGRSDTDTVIRFQEDVLRARLEVIAAARRYREAVVDLRLAEGTSVPETEDPP